MTLKEIFLHGAEFAAYAYEKVGAVTPMWVGEDADGEHIPVQAPVMSAAVAHAVADNIKEVFRLNGVVQFVSMLEGWLVTDEDGEIEEEYQSGDRPGREHPRRREVILISASNGHEKLFGFYWIIRDGTVPRLSEFNINANEPQDTGALGPFDNLLDYKEERLQ